METEKERGLPESPISRLAPWWFVSPAVSDVGFHLVWDGIPPEEGVRSTQVTLSWFKAWNIFFSSKENGNFFWKNCLTDRPLSGV
jgi:hypothetical protein